MTDITRAELEQIAASAAATAVRETLTSLGIDASDPIKAQGDFQLLRDMRGLMGDKEFEADLAHLRRWRLAVSDIQSKGVMASMGLLITGFGAIVILGIRKWLEG